MGMSHKVAEINRIEVMKCSFASLYARYMMQSIAVTTPACIIYDVCWLV